MIARLGNVIYWAACVIAALFVAYAVFLYATAPSARHGAPGTAAMATLAAVAVWAIGRACRYIMACR